MPSEGPFPCYERYSEMSLSEKAMAIEKELHRLREENDKLREINEELKKENELMRKKVSDLMLDIFKKQDEEINGKK